MILKYPLFFKTASVIGTLVFCNFAFSQIEFDSIENSFALQLQQPHTNYLRVDNKLQQDPACNKLIEYAQINMNTSGLVIVHEGQVKIELYSRLANRNTKSRAWSASKLFSGLMLGSQVQKQGMTLLDKSLSSLGIQRAKNSKDIYQDWSKVTLRNVWNMSSGLDWCEYTTCKGADAASMTYGKGRSDALNYVLNIPLSHEPGTYYRYSAGNYILLQAALKSLDSSHEDYLNSPYENIFSVLGVSKNEYAFETDGKSLYLGGSGLSLTTRTFSKLGQLILNKGIWEGTQVFPLPFYEEMTRNSEAIKSSPKEIQFWEGPSGASIWLNDDSLNGDGRDRDGIPAFFPTSPWDMIYGGGYLGQYLLIYPSSELVVARMGGDKDFYDHASSFSELALKCFDPAQVRERPTPETPRVVPDLGKNITTARFYKEGILPASRSKELCSCLFVGGYNNVGECDLAVPLSVDLFGRFDTNDFSGRVSVDYANKSVTVRKPLSRELYYSFLNEHKPELGCSLKKIQF